MGYYWLLWYLKADQVIFAQGAQGMPLSTVAGKLLLA